MRAPSELRSHELFALELLAKTRFVDGFSDKYCAPSCCCDKPEAGMIMRGDEHITASYCVISVCSTVGQYVRHRWAHVLPRTKPFVLGRGPG